MITATTTSGAPTYYKGAVVVFVNLYQNLDQNIAAAASASSTPWIVDLDGGFTKVSLDGDLYMKGHSIREVSAISGVAEKWSIDESGKLVVEGLEVRGTVKVGSPDRRTGITLFDEVSGDPYCLSIIAGVVTSAAGECDAQGASLGESGIPSDDEEPAIVEEDDEESPAETEDSDEEAQEEEGDEKDRAADSEGVESPAEEETPEETVADEEEESSPQEEPENEVAPEEESGEDNDNTDE